MHIRYAWQQWFVFILLFPVLGCPPPPPPPVLPPAPLLPQRVDSDSILPWATQEAVLVVVDKGCQELRLYQYGHLVVSYPIVFGRRPGQKIHQGDKRTPVGLYMVIGKRHHQRWSRFMLLDYPTPSDWHRYQLHLAGGQVPLQSGKDPGAGSEIGIHGTNHIALNEASVNWTLGCISLLNPDVRALYASVAEGTLVYIKE